MTPPRCRICLMEDLPRGDALRAVLEERLALMPAEERVPEAEYRRRLERCRTCGELREGTCALCGCYVELRLARKAKDCPKKTN